jgi:hypothetical protein
MRQGSGVRNQESGIGSPGSGAAIARLRGLVWIFVAVAILALPFFAHGCHGDDVDHEPLLMHFG